MDIREMQILFQQKIEDVNPIFKEAERPDTFTIANYFNKAIKRYLEEKYLSLPSFEHRLVMIESNFDELSKLTQMTADLSPVRDTSQYNWSTRGTRFRAPSDVLIPFSLSCSVSRNEIYAMSSQKVFADFVSRRQAEKIISHSNDKVMYPRPICVWEDPYYIMVIGDAFTTAITAPYLSYIRKPYIMSFGYQSLTASSEFGNLNISAITDGSYFLMRSYSQYVDSGGTPTNYNPGDKVQKITGYNTVTNIGGSGETCSVGYPYGETDTPDFPAYLHDRIIEIASQLFLDQAKLKLIPKSE